MRVSRWSNLRKVHKKADESQQTMKILIKKKNNEKIVWMHIYFFSFGLIAEWEWFIFIGQGEENSTKNRTTFVLLMPSIALSKHSSLQWIVLWVNYAHFHYRPYSLHHIAAHIDYSKEKRNNITFDYEHLRAQFEPLSRCVKFEHWNARKQWARIMHFIALHRTSHTPARATI